MKKVSLWEEDGLGIIQVSVLPLFFTYGVTSSKSLKLSVLVSSGGKEVNT